MHWSASKSWLMSPAAPRACCSDCSEHTVLQGLPVWLEHPAAMDYPTMEQAGITQDDFCFYQVRGMEVRPPSCCCFAHLHLGAV